MFPSPHCFPRIINESPSESLVINWLFFLLSRIFVNIRRTLKTWWKEEMKAANFLNSQSFAVLLYTQSANISSILYEYEWGLHIQKELVTRRPEGYSSFWPRNIFVSHTATISEFWDKNLDRCSVIIFGQWTWILLTNLIPELSVQSERRIQVIK